jgi:hypothetical protein
MLYRAVGEPAKQVKHSNTSTYQGPVEQLGVLATLSRWRPRVQIPSGPHTKSRRKAALLLSPSGARRHLPGPAPLVTGRAERDDQLKRYPLEQPVLRG